MRFSGDVCSEVELDTDRVVLGEAVGVWGGVPDDETTCDNAGGFGNGRSGQRKRRGVGRHGCGRGGRK